MVIVITSLEEGELFVSHGVDSDTLHNIPLENTNVKSAIREGLIVFNRKLG